MHILLTPLTTASSESNAMSSVWMMVMLAGIFALMYFFLIRPQKKKEKKDQQMRSNLQIGDEIVTAGGIIGIVFSIKDDTVVIETGGDRSKIRIKRYAIASVETIHDNA